jgi:hypothetical protein
MRAPFAPDPENEGICTEVGSLGQEIQLESGDHLNALERIYLYTQSKASFHRCAPVSLYPSNSTR